VVAKDLRKSKIALRASSSEKSAHALLDKLRQIAAVLKQNARESVLLKE
jgi:ABC-type hemin transport system substrate-binding protein